MSAISRKLWSCGPPQRDPIVLAIIGVLWGHRNGPNCEKYAAPSPGPQTAQAIAAALAPEYTEEQVFQRLRLWSSRGLFKAVPCVGAGNIGNPEASFIINPVAAQVNIKNILYLSPNAIIPVSQDRHMCCFNPCVDKKGSIESLDNYRFVRQPFLATVRQRQAAINRRNPANVTCGSIYCSENI